MIRSELRKEQDLKDAKEDIRDAEMVIAMLNEVKPCPFCGYVDIQIDTGIYPRMVSEGEHILFTGWRSKGVDFHCDNCGVTASIEFSQYIDAQTRYEVASSALSRAISIWNNRYFEKTD